MVSKALSWIGKNLLPCCFHNKQESAVAHSSCPEAQCASICDARDGKAASAFFSAHQETPTPHFDMDMPPDDRPVQPPVHMRVFTNVAIHDADMLFPGATAVFTLLDNLLIWVPVLIGVVSAIYKVSSSVRYLTLLHLVSPKMIFWPSYCTNHCVSILYQPLRLNTVPTIASHPVSQERIQLTRIQLTFDAT